MSNDAVLKKISVKVKKKYPLVFKSKNVYSSVGKHIVDEWVFYIEAKN